MIRQVDLLLRVVLIKGTDRREYSIETSPAGKAIRFTIDRGAGWRTSHGVLTSRPRARNLRETLVTEIASLLRDGWREVGA